MSTHLIYLAAEALFVGLVLGVLALARCNRDDIPTVLRIALDAIRGGFGRRAATRTDEEAAEDRNGEDLN